MLRLPSQKIYDLIGHCGHSVLLYWLWCGSDDCPGGRFIAFVILPTKALITFPTYQEFACLLLYQLRFILTEFECQPLYCPLLRSSGSHRTSLQNLPLEKQHQLLILSLHGSNPVLRHLTTDYVQVRFSFNLHLFEEWLLPDAFDL